MTTANTVYRLTDSKGSHIGLAYRQGTKWIGMHQGVLPKGAVCRLGSKSPVMVEGKTLQDVMDRIAELDS